MVVKVKKVPLRMCLGCQEMLPKRELIRVVRSPEGEVFLDATGKRNGRGAYICRSVQCLDKAIKAKRFEKAFAHQIPEEILNSLRSQLGG